MEITQNERVAAAYALNLWTVSIKQIIDYNDVNIMKFEYETIMNNLNLEKMPKDDALLDVIKSILDQITYSLMSQGDRKFLEKEYQHQMNNAIWSAVPNVGAIFATTQPIAMSVTLATQVGIGYMNYRRNKAEIDLKYEKSKWEISKNCMEHLNGLQKQLFDTAWRLAERYNFPDEYRLTEKQIEAYNAALMESNPIKRFNYLKSMSSNFDAYPSFWYQIGSTANSIYNDARYSQEVEVKARYRAYALECFYKYEELNKFNLMRHDIITSAWALEFIELLDLNQNNEPEKARELIDIAIKYSGGQMDIIELCAFASLRIQDYENAIKHFSQLVNQDYNIRINAQILSGLYIREIILGGKNASEAKIDYKQLKNILKEEDWQYIIPLPPEGVTLENWKPKWNKEKTFEEFQEQMLKQKEREHKKKEELKEKARDFFKKPITLVYKSTYQDIAEYAKSVIEEQRNKVDSALPSVTLCEYKMFKRNRNEIENNGRQVILIGKSNIAHTFIKNVNCNKFDYSKYGIQYVSNRNRSLIVASWPKNSELDGLVLLARKMSEKHSIKIPEGVEGINFSFMKEIFEGTFDDSISFVATILTTIVASPLLIVGQGLENALNTIQFAQNTLAKKKIEFLQYCVGLYLFLESKNALIE